MTQSLFVRMAQIKADPALQVGSRGARKLAVTRVYDRVEKQATAPCWAPPAAGQACPVLQLPATEMAVFNQNADQQRHYHAQATEIYVVVAGTMAIEIDGVAHQMQTGDAVIISPGVVHEVKNQGLKFTSYVISANCGGPKDKYPA
ncbi:MAG: cupin domain-containing protein [Desulfobacterales bacterium]|nr:cupin domain-containing protein [Desulfobacterales bacterium]